jgi:hypothetical protein
MKRLLRLFVFLAFAPALYACALESLMWLGRYDGQRIPVGFLLGIALSWIIYGLVLRGNIEFVRVFRHELTHMLVGLVYGRVYKFTAKDPTYDDGEQEEEEGEAVGKVLVTPSTFLSTLAPYCLPILAIPLIVSRAFIGGIPSHILDFAIAVFLVFHLSTVLKQFRFSQSDIKKMGYLFSFLFVVTVNFFVVAITLNVVLGNSPFIGTYLIGSYDRTIHIYGLILNWAVR